MKIFKEKAKRHLTRCANMEKSNAATLRQRISARCAEYRHQSWAVSACRWCEAPALYRSYLANGTNLGACATHKDRLPRIGSDAA